MAQQDDVAVVSLDVAVEIDVDGPMQAKIGSGQKVAIDSGVMAKMGSTWTMVTKRGSNFTRRREE
jgi:hypothetical protein